MTLPLSIPEAASPRTAKKTRRLPLLKHYLEEQRRLTAVERFAQRHQAESRVPDDRRYRDLIPLERPGPGEQLAFEVDLDACTGCKACVAACHRLNGLDDEEGEVWRRVGLLHGGNPSEPVQQTVTTACHHCVDPGCMKGCPVGAYEKDPVTGIVRHLDDQCFGCQYCTLTCPYEVPQYSASRGIVRKCDLCSDRLAVGEAPACVQACPNEAIAVRIVNTARVVEAAQGEPFLPGAPVQSLTVPTTTYKTKRSLPRNLEPADQHQLRPGHQHLPLVVLLVLTQLSVGAFAAELVLGVVAPEAFGYARPYLAVVAFALGQAGLGAAMLHLGRPRYAFRAILGFRTSWMSREAALFGGFAALGALYTGSFWLGPAAALFELALPFEIPAWLQNGLGALVVASGLLGVFCSMMLYQVTGRRYWSTGRTTLRFVLTGAVLGVATALATALSLSLVVGSGELGSFAAGALVLPLLLLGAVKLAADAQVFVHLFDSELGELKKSALLHVRQLKWLTLVRFVAGLAALASTAVILLSDFALSGLGLSLLSLSALALYLGAEFAERMLFFAAVAPRKMPGAVGP